jgi:hypothetical protein
MIAKNSNSRSLLMEYLIETQEMADIRYHAKL